MEDLRDLTIVDVDCGKGKVVYYLFKKFRNFKLNNAIIGVELDNSLSNIAIKNLDLLRLKPKPLIINRNALDFDLSHLGKTVFIILYNPFDAYILSEFLKKNYQYMKYISNTNPIHHETILSNSFIMIKEKKSWHPNLNTTIYLNSVKC